jgi:PTS system ascorbate-specific IIA component
MPGLLIIAHEPLASALRQAVEHVYLEQTKRVLTLDVGPCALPEAVELQARQLLDLVRDPQALILVDVYGATPGNVAQRLTDGVNVRLVTGVNVPMLWRALCYLDEPIEKLVARAVAGGTQGVMQLAASRPQTQSLPRQQHDPFNSHDQQ